MNIRATYQRQFFTAVLLTVLCLAKLVFAQATDFTYQGKLTDAGNPANGNYDLQFKLFDTATVGTGVQQGATLVRNPVAASAGVFTVTLDFGANAFSGAARHLEIGVRPAGSGSAYTVLAPRQPVTSTPYAIQTLNAQQLGGINASEYVTTANGGNTFVKNATAQQPGNFNISGSGIVGDSLGVGTTPNPGFKLDMIGNARITTANGAVIQFASPNAESGMTTTFNSGRADLRFDGSTLKLVAGLVGGPPPATNGIIINTGGNVGIGTTNLTNAQLNVNGFAQDAIVGMSSFGIGVSGQGVFGGVRGFTDTNGARGVFGISINGTGVEGSSNGGNNFAVFSNGYLGVDRLGTGGNTNMCRNADNQFATCGSSLRYKTDWQPYGGGLNVINRLQSLTYRWKSDHSPDVGFGAEAVAEIEPLLVTRNENGEVEGVKYDRLSVVFVNAFKEQQAQLEQQQQQIKQQQQQLDGLKKLLCQIQPQAAICQ